MLDDNIYYNEQGTEIYREVNDKPDKHFVIKITQTTSDLYGEADYPDKGKSNPISAEAAVTTEAEISKGNLKGEHMKNVVSLGTTKSIQKMLNIIKDDGTITATTPDSVVDPSKAKNVSINGKVDFHSHPSGEKTVGNTTYFYIQPPSGTDIKNANGSTKRVFGMGSQTMYMYDGKGVKATIPMSIFQK